MVAFFHRARDTDRNKNLLKVRDSVSQVDRSIVLQVA